MKKRLRFSLRSLLLAVTTIAIIAGIGRYAWDRLDPPQLRQLRSRGLVPRHVGIRDGHVAYLYFSGPDVGNLSPLSELTDLETLYLSVDSVDDLAPLHGLDKLELVDFRGAQVSDEQIDRLKQALPDCEIRR